MVTGASRGIGRGIAIGLGEAGATVYVTGRTLTEGDAALPGSIASTAEAVSAAGGRGIAIACDHGDDAQVEEAFIRVERERGRIDLLVNNATATPYPWADGAPFWTAPLQLWDRWHQVGLRSHFVAASFAARIMIHQGAGLIVNISSSGAQSYFNDVPYHAAKAAVDKMTADMAHELRPHNVAVVSLWPGPTRTEGMLAQPGSIPLDASSSPVFNGRAVAAMAADEGIMEISGTAVRASALAQKFGFEDIEAD